MAVEFQHLSDRERQALLRLNRGGPMLNPDTEAIDKLTELGLTEQKLGGLGLSRQGHEVLAKVAAMVRRRKERQSSNVKG